MGEILRATAFHTPRNAFHYPDALVAIPDAALVIEAGRILELGPYSDIAPAYPEWQTRDLRPGILLPGLIDTHVHYPQIRILGGLGYELLDWLERHTLPEEARLADPTYAGIIAKEFLKALIDNGTTTALVFGAHFSEAMQIFFDAAAASGLRIASGLVLSDRMLLPTLHQTPDAAYRQSRALIDRHHRRGRLLYAVTPRFALSASESMLEVCQSLLAETPDLRFQTHINENPLEIMEVARMFPQAKDYLDVYEQYNLVDRRSVLAHNVHATEVELGRLAHTGATVSHCPCSNAALGSGIFPMQRHLDAGVPFALGTDVGGGTGFSLFKEALQSYLMQRVAPEGLTLSPAQLLYLATKAGAEALGLADETGDLAPGHAADYICLRPSSPLPDDSAEDQLAALITRATPAEIVDVAVCGTRVK